MEMSDPGMLRMAKVQKSLLIHEDLVRSLGSVQKLTGASFTRLITAAVVQYLFARPEGPDPEWMKLAMGLDDGDLTLADIVEERSSISNAHRNLIGQLYNQGNERAKAKYGKADDPVYGLSDIRDYFLTRARDEVKQWRDIIEGPSKDVVENLLSNWAVSRGKSGA